MKTLISAAALVALASLTLTNSSAAHGGTYRGPGDTVPPGAGGGGGGGPSTPGPAGPSTPGPAGPTTPGPAGTAPTTPGGPAAAPRTGQAPTADLTTWQFWWGFNKEYYLNLKQHVGEGGPTSEGVDFFGTGNGKSETKDTMRPSEETIRKTIVPALAKALKEEHSKDIITGCLVGLAKIGDVKDESGKSEMFENIRPALSGKGEQEIGETAALSLGILANDSDAIIELLGMLVQSKPADIHAKYKDVTFETEVPLRTRTFAAYGLGLIGARSSTDSSKVKIIDTILATLANTKRGAQRDIPVACITSFGLVPLAYDANDDAVKAGKVTECKTRNDQLRYLLDYYKDGENDYMVRAHVPTAMARLLKDVPSASKLRATIVKAMLDDLQKDSKAKPEVKESCMLALGQVGDCDNDPLDVEIRKTILASNEPNLYQEQQIHFYAMISAAQIGGQPGTGEGEPLAGLKDIRKFLLDYLAKGKGNEKSWAGLSLGVLENALALHKTNATSSEVAKTLTAALADSKTPGDIGAFAIGLGLMENKDAQTVLRDKFEKVSDADAQGYLAVGLGLLGSRESIKPIEDVVHKAKYKPELLRSAAIGLGLLGDKKIVADLISMLGEASGQASQAAIASALGYIGDARSVKDLVGFLENKEKTDGARGFAAAALGIVADKEMFPWGAKISVNINYRANTPTLTSPDNGTGLLDIL